MYVCYLICKMQIHPIHIHGTIVLQKISGCLPEILPPSIHRFCLGTRGIPRYHLIVRVLSNTPKNNDRGSHTLPPISSNSGPGAVFLHNAVGPFPSRCQDWLRFDGVFNNHKIIILIKTLFLVFAFATS